MCDKSLVTFSDFKVKKKSKKVSIQSMTFNWLFFLWLSSTETWLLSQQKVIKSLLTFPDFSLIFSLTFYDFSVISQSNKIDLSQWKVREKSDISLTLHDFFLTFPLTFFDWNLTSQSIKSQLKSSKLLDFHQHCLTFPWTFLDFLWLLSQVSVKKNGLQSIKSQWKVKWLFTDFCLTFFFTEHELWYLELWFQFDKVFVTNLPRVGYQW